MHQLQTGYDSGQKSILEVMAYVSFQELATRISHRNTGKVCDDPAADKLLARVAADENLHMIFYRDLVSDALQVAPSEMVQAIAHEVRTFQMPGTGIQDFLQKAKQIAKAGIYDLRIHHDEVIWPLLRKWEFFELEGLTPAAEQARIDTAGFLDELNALASRFEARRAERMAS
jgi:acyl-[acyl-carrier-protein] desaturase